MRSACIAIGIDNVAGVSGLTPLNAAAANAIQFANWASNAVPAFETTKITDEGGPVYIADIKKAIADVVASRAYDQLIVYFAGHGILRSWDTEMWLLSQAASDPNEAVNLIGSIRYARNSGIPHIVFISDACRSVPADRRLSQVEGSVIFPISLGTRQRPPEIDAYYASLPGDPAYELASDEAHQRYDGVFTKCLLEGLAGVNATVREPLNDTDDQIEVVSSRSLKPWLEVAVQNAVLSASITLEQIPELRVESQKPKYITQCPPRTTDLDLVFASVTPVPPPITPGHILRNLAEDNGVPFLAADEGSPEYRSGRGRGEANALNEEVEQLLSTVGRESFETQTGFTVVGTTVTEANMVESVGGAQLFEEHGASQIRVLETNHGGSVLLQFADGTGTCVASLPGFIGTVQVKDGRVADVSYVPSRNSIRWSEYESSKSRLDRCRAVAAVAARRGLLRVDDKRAASFAHYVRQLKGLDPTLGIYAAYAYSQIGEIGQIEGIYDWLFRHERIPVPFDIALLAEKFEHPDALGQQYCPGMPMLTQGWSLLHDQLFLPEWLLQARRFTLPSLWTTFSVEGYAFVKQALIKR